MDFKSLAQQVRAEMQREQEQKSVMFGSSLKKFEFLAPISLYNLMQQTSSHSSLCLLDCRVHSVDSLEKGHTIRTAHVLPIATVHSNNNNDIFHLFAQEALALLQYGANKAMPNTIIQKASSLVSLIADTIAQSQTIVLFGDASQVSQFEKVYNQLSQQQDQQQSASAPDFYSRLASAISVGCDASQLANACFFAAVASAVSKVVPHSKTSASSRQVCILKSGALEQCFSSDYYNTNCYSFLSVPIASNAKFYSDLYPFEILTQHLYMFTNANPDQVQKSISLLHMDLVLNFSSRPCFFEHQVDKIEQYRHETLEQLKQQQAEQILAIEKQLKQVESNKQLFEKLQNMLQVAIHKQQQVPEPLLLNKKTTSVKRYYNYAMSDTVTPPPKEEEEQQAEEQEMQLVKEHVEKKQQANIILPLAQVMNLIFAQQEEESASSAANKKILVLCDTSRVIGPLVCMAYMVERGQRGVIPRKITIGEAAKHIQKVNPDARPLYNPFLYKQVEAYCNTTTTSLVSTPTIIKKK